MRTYFVSALILGVGIWFLSQFFQKVEPQPETPTSEIAEQTGSTQAFANAKIKEPPVQADARDFPKTSNHSEAAPETPIPQVPAEKPAQTESPQPTPLPRRLSELIKSYNPNQFAARVSNATPLSSFSINQAYQCNDTYQAKFIGKSGESMVLKLNISALGPWESRYDCLSIFSGGRRVYEALAQQGEIKVLQMEEGHCTFVIKDGFYIEVLTDIPRTGPRWPNRLQFYRKQSGGTFEYEGFADTIPYPLGTPFENVCEQTEIVSSAN